jgi:hypothetical protein
MKPRLNYEILRKGGAHDDKRRKYGFYYDPFEWIDELGLDSEPVKWPSVKWESEGEEDGNG